MSSKKSNKDKDRVLPVQLKKRHEDAIQYIMKRRGITHESDVMRQALCLWEDHLREKFDDPLELEAI